MVNHARDKGTAEWLKAEYGDHLPAFPIMADGAAMDMPWSKVQHRIAQLIAQDKFYTQAEPEEPFPYSVGDTVYLEDGKGFVITDIQKSTIQLQDPALHYPIFRAESRESFTRLMERYPQQAQSTPEMTAETAVVYQADKNHLPYDVVIESLHTGEPEHTSPAVQSIAENFHITDDHFGEGGAKAKFRANMDAIHTLQTIEAEQRTATPEEQQILSRYVC